MVLNQPLGEGRPLAVKIQDHDTNVITQMPLRHLNGVGFVDRTVLARTIGMMDHPQEPARAVSADDQGNVPNRVREWV